MDNPWVFGRDTINRDAINRVSTVTIPVYCRPCVIHSLRLFPENILPIKSRIFSIKQAIRLMGKFFRRNNPNNSDVNISDTDDTSKGRFGYQGGTDIIEPCRSKATFDQPHRSPLPEGEGALCCFTFKPLYITRCSSFYSLILKNDANESIKSQLRPDNQAIMAIVATWASLPPWERD